MPASLQPSGDGGVEAAELRHGFADDRRVEVGQFLGQVVVDDAIAEIPQANSRCQTADESELLHAQQEVPERLRDLRLSHSFPGAEELETRFEGPQEAVAEGVVRFPLLR
jgi:hypothetical protein